jgi:hypothetical protein
VKGTAIALPTFSFEKDLSNCFILKALSLKFYDSKSGLGVANIAYIVQKFMGMASFLQEILMMEHRNWRGRSLR